MKRGAATFMISLAVLASLWIVAPARGADTLEAVKKKGTLVVGVRADAPPFGFLDREGGNVVGVEPELAAAVAKRIGVTLSLKRLSADERVQALLNGDVDLLAATMTRTGDRAKVMDFSSSYFRTTQRVLARKGAVTTVESLQGKKVATAPGTAAEKALREKAPGAACYFFPNAERALEALRKGEVDAITASGPTLYGCLEGLPKGEYEVPGAVTLSEEKFRFAVRKGDKALLEAVNATLESLEKSGDAKAILDKWFRPETPSAVAKGAPPAIGAVTRSTGTAGRFIVLPLKGIFRTGAEVSILDPGGATLGKGRVANIYEDEVYVDGEGLPAGMPQAGFPVTMNYSPSDAKAFIAAKGDLFTGVKEDSKRESEQRLQEEATAFERDRKERERYQEDMTKAKMYLDYQYSDEYYRYWRPYWP